jgi:hypothetical protein
MAPVTRLENFKGDNDQRLIDTLEFRKLTRDDVIIIEKPNTNTVVVIDNRLRFHKPG